MDFVHCLARLYNRPHMIAPEKLDTILSALSPRLTGQIGAFIKNSDETRLPEAHQVVEGIAIVPVHGTLVRRGGFMAAQSGLTSYDGLRASFIEAVSAPDVRAVLLDIDSYGGEAGGVFDLVEEWRALSRSYQKPIWAHANEMACSAAYAIACAAEQIWLSRTSDVGSIGVVTAHMDQSKADAKDGLRWTYIFAGENKVDGNPHEPLSDGARAKIQEDCDTLYHMFVDLVAKARHCSRQQIIDTRADTFLGQEAITQGLADRLGTFDTALQQLIETTKTQEGQNVWLTETTASRKMMMMQSKKNAKTPCLMKKKTRTTQATKNKTTKKNATPAKAPIQKMTTKKTRKTSRKAALARLG